MHHVTWIFDQNLSIAWVNVQCHSLHPFALHMCQAPLKYQVLVCTIMVWPLM